MHLLPRRIRELKMLSSYLMFLPLFVRTKYRGLQAACLFVQNWNTLEEIFVDNASVELDETHLGRQRLNWFSVDFEKSKIFWVILSCI